jgi:polyisoprenoid-binding protein YceI
MDPRGGAKQLKPLLILFMVLAVHKPVYGQTFLALNGRAVFESKASTETFQGVSPNLVGLVNMTDSTVDFYLDLNTLKTGISLRDRAMRDQYLETKTFPFAEFKGRLRTLFDQTLRVSQPVVAQGLFTVHGVPRPIDVVGTITPLDADRLRLEAEWSLNLNDHDITVPSFLMLRLSETIRISIDITLKRVP